MPGKCGSREPNYERVNVERKPEWLKCDLKGGADYGAVAKIVDENALHTICGSGKCPNKTECWSRRTATFMVLGDVCTRSCGFCATHSGKPLPVDSGEPLRVARSVVLMGLRHAVVTSVTRDDLPDGGAGHWAAVVGAVRAKNPDTTIEILVPDFDGRAELLDIILAAGADIVGHNLETVRRLTPGVRSRASYEVSLDVLRCFSMQGAVTKSGLMLGLGETPDEVLEVMDDLRAAGVTILTLGQYLQPTREHLPVVSYVEPAMFDFYKERAIERGFSYVASGPLVRSSYMAEQALAAL